MTTTPTAAKPGPYAVGFDPNKPYLTRDGREVRELRKMTLNGFIGRVFVAGIWDEFQWWGSGAYIGGCEHPLDLVNISDAPTPRDPVTRPDGGEDDVVFVERMDRTMRPDRMPEDDARLRSLAHRGVLAPTADAVAWSYELKYSTGGEYTDQWLAPQLTFNKPCVPKGAVRNLTPLYTHPQAALAATPAGLTPDGGLRLVPAEPTLAMLKAGFDALSKLYPPRQNGGEAIGQFVVWEAMLAAASTQDGGCTSVATSGDTDDAAWPPFKPCAIDYPEGGMTEFVQADVAIVWTPVRNGIEAGYDMEDRTRLVAVRWPMSRTASPRACAEPVTEAEVEAAAKAMFELSPAYTSSSVSQENRWTWEKNVPDSKAYWRERARAALKAARTTTATPAPGQTDGRRGS